MHGELENTRSQNYAETLKSLFLLGTNWTDLKEQQRRLNKFVKKHNNVSPHKALAMKTPVEIHDFSTRPFTKRISNYDYDPTYKVLKVIKNGAIRWKSYYWVYF